MTICLVQRLGRVFNPKKKKRPLKRKQTNKWLGEKKNGGTSLPTNSNSHAVNVDRARRDHQTKEGDLCSYGRTRVVVSIAFHTGRRVRDGLASLKGPGPNRT